MGAPRDEHGTSEKGCFDPYFRKNRGVFCEKTRKIKVSYPIWNSIVGIDAYYKVK